MNTYSKAQVEQLMVKHYPVCANEQYNHWNCNCGTYIDFLRCWPDHVKAVLRKNPGDTK